MNGKKVKEIRKELRKAGIAISAEPYTMSRGTIYASNRRRMYQRKKKEYNNG